jgi:hypothetical protein
VPFPVRRARALIVTACLAGAAFGAPGAALAQSAGDDQYQDPLAGQTQTAPATTSTAPDPATTPQLTPNAGTSSGSTGSTSGSSGTAGTPATGTTTSPAQSDATSLPNTGVDGRIVAALGFGLLLCGFGLRLRTARERF